MSQSTKTNDKKRTHVPNWVETLKLKKILEDIRNRNMNLAILGSGYVGLPTAALFADAGFQVTAIDIKPDIVNSINNRLCTFKEPGLQALISNNVHASRLRAALTSPEILAQADIIIVSIQTPINKNNEPNLSYLTNGLKDVGKIIKKDKLVVIGSTIPPGTMFEQVKPKLKSLSGLEPDKDFYLAYVPERIAPKNALKEFVESPRLVGGIGSNSTKVAAELFRTVCKKVIETDAATAEISKLAENTYRDVNIAFANQLALICEQHEIDVIKVIELANTHPRVNLHTPGPGVGGPCLPKDPYLLLHSSKPIKHDIIKTARKLNDYMPIHTLDLLLHALKKTNKDIRNSKIVVLGTAYKADVDDSRLSASGSLIPKLMRLGAEVVVYDPYCNESFGAEKAKSLYEAIEGADCLVIMTDHLEFKNLNIAVIKKLMNHKPALVDGRRIVNPEESEKYGLLYYGIGFGVDKE